MAYIRIGTPIQSIGYFAFTRKAAHEARDRMLLKNPQYKKKRIKIFSNYSFISFSYFRFKRRECNARLSLQ